MLKSLKRRFSSIASDLINQGRLRQARFYLSESLASEEQKERNKQDIFDRINKIKKLSYCELNLKNHATAEQYIEQILFEIKNNSILDQKTQSGLLKSCYEIYFLFLMSHNLSKGIKIGSELHQQWNSPKLISLVNFYMGFGGILKDDFLTAKDFLYKVTDDNTKNANDYNLILKSAMAFNNLGIACWWDRHPNYSSVANEFEEEGDEDDSDELEYTEKMYRTKESDFSYASDMLQSSIYKFESYLEGYREKTLGLAHEDLTKGDIQGQNTQRLLKLIDFLNHEFESDASFELYDQIILKEGLLKNPMSAIPLFNLAEMLISTNKNFQSRKLGIIYLHFAHNILKNNLKVISNDNTLGEHMGMEKELFDKMYSDYANIYRSLFIRSHIIYSTITDLKMVW